jgi:hypothetical protein
MGSSKSWSSLMKFTLTHIVASLNSKNEIYSPGKVKRKQPTS